MTTETSNAALPPFDASSKPLSPTPRSTLGRKAYRASAERADLYAVLDAGMICHLAMQLDGSTIVLPTGYGRDGDTLYLHGSSGARTMRAAAAGEPVCVAVTLVDGVVYARSVNSHSMNYRSAVVHGVAVECTEREAKLHGLRAVTDHLAPGSWEYARQPNKRELAATTLLALDLAEASVKIRTGPPGDDDEDVEANVAWAGVLPVRTVFGEPWTAPELVDSFGIPGHVTGRE